MRAVTARAKARPELAVLVVVLLSTLLLPKRAPLGIYALGIVSASIILLPALGIILVQRSNRIVNFSQVAIASATTSLFTVLTASRKTESGGDYGYFPVVRGVAAICSPCVNTHGSDPEFILLGRWTFLANYVLSAVLAILFAVVLSMACYLIVQRVSAAPRLVVTVATLFVAQLTAAIAVEGVELLLPSEQSGSKGIGYPAVPPPVSLTLKVGATTFRTAEITVVVVTLLAGALLALYFGRSRSGTAIRAAAENPARVATLGINAAAVVSRVWLTAGVLAGVAGILLAMLQGVSEETTSPLAVNLLVRILGVVVLARMVNLPVAIGASLVIGVAEQATRWSFGSTAVLDGSLLAIIGVTLLLQHDRASRADLEGAGSWQADREIRPIPRELRPLPAVRRWLRILTIVGAVVAVGLPWVLSAPQITDATIGLLYMMLGLSLLVLTGWAGQISLGQVALAACGAHVAIRSGAPFVVALVIGAAAGAAAAVLIGIPALRLRGLHLAIVTLAFAVSTSSFVLDRRYLGKHLPSQIDRPTILGLHFDDGRSYYYLMLALLALVTASVVGMRRSRTARVLIALRDNQQAAESFGIPASRLRLSAFALSGAIAGLAGTLIAYADGAVDPSRFTPDFGVELFLSMVIGGFGHLVGPFIGGAYHGFVPMFGEIGGFVVRFGGIGGLLLLLVLGGGLSQLVFRVRDNLLRRVANRHQIVVPSLVADLRVDGVERRLPIEPKRRQGGGTAFVPRRYRIAKQWGLGDAVALQELPEDAGRDAEEVPARA